MREITLIKSGQINFSLRTIIAGLVTGFFILNWLSFNYAQPTEISYEELEQKYVPQSKPEETVRLELDLLAKGMYCYDLLMFDLAWRKRGKQILSSPQYKNTARKFDVSSKVYTEGNYAIVYYPYNKNEGPDFLYKDSSGGWVLDRTAVWDYIHYNYSNTGWFAYEGDYPYLEMLKKVFPLERVKLDSGAWAYRIKE